MDYCGEGQRVCWPPSQIIKGPGPPAPPPPSYAYVLVANPMYQISNTKSYSGVMVGRTMVLCNFQLGINKSKAYCVQNILQNYEVPFCYKSLVL